MRGYVQKLENKVMSKLALLLGALAMLAASTASAKCGLVVFYEEEIPESLIKKEK